MHISAVWVLESLSVQFRYDLKSIMIQSIHLKLTVIQFNLDKFLFFELIYHFRHILQLFHIYILHLLTV